MSKLSLIFATSCETQLQSQNAHFKRLLTVMLLLQTKTSSVIGHKELSSPRDHTVSVSQGKLSHAAQKPSPI